MGDTSTNMNQMDFGFAFNDVDFSDRILRVEIMTDSREDEVANSNDSNCSMTVQVKTFHISSPILAAKSPFFYKLFKNGMRESQQRDAILRINASEEASLMELLKYMYSNTLSVTSAPDLLGVLMAADKFEHSPCMRYCLKLFNKIPMSLELAILCLELPSSVLVGEIVQPLLNRAEYYFALHYKDFIKCQEEAMALPLSAIKAVLKSDGLLVNSEDDVFNFILEWARAHYPKLEERREILTKDLVQFLCFPYMSSSELKKVLGCPDFDHEQVSKLVFEALFSKIEDPHGLHFRASPSKDLGTTKCRFPRRDYSQGIGKVVQLEFSGSGCVVYLDIKKVECFTLCCQSRQFYSLPFCFGGRCFFFLAKCTRDKQASISLFLQMTENSEACTLDYESAVMNKSSMEFETRYKIKNYTLTCDKELELFTENLGHHIDGILHFRLEVAINNS